MKQIVVCSDGGIQEPHTVGRLTSIRKRLLSRHQVGRGLDCDQAGAAFGRDEIIAFEMAMEWCRSHEV